jgi:hypothetical protein
LFHAGGNPGFFLYGIDERARSQTFIEDLVSVKKTLLFQFVTDAARSADGDLWTFAGESGIECVPVWLIFGPIIELLILE